MKILCARGLLVAALLTIVAGPAAARRLNCAAVRAALARGKLPIEVALEFQTSTRRVLDCQHDKGRHVHGPRRWRTPTPIPARTDFPTPEPTKELPRRH